MKSTTLERIALLLEVLRANAALREVRPAAFTLGGRDFLHFHDEPEGIFADVRLARGFLRMPVSSESEQAELLERVDHCLSALEVSASARQRCGRPRR